MGIKKSNLDKLVEEKINVHNYKEIFNIDELLEYSKTHNSFSIRFDCYPKKDNLPFYVYDEKKVENKVLFFNDIINNMNKLNCSIIVSDGYKYDSEMKFNFVIEINKNNDFILELCDKKVPLRNMYEYKTTIINGNIFSDYKSFEFKNKLDNHYEETDICNIIKLILEHNLKYTYIEGTIYKKNVGIFNKSIVVWQTN